MLPQVTSETIATFVEFFESGKLSNDLRDKFVDEQPELNEMVIDNCAQLAEAIQAGEIDVNDVINFAYSHVVLAYSLLKRQQELGEFEELMNA